MSSATIRVAPRNPGQVFACLGLLELAEVLLGSATGGFSADAGQFTLAAGGAANPVPACLDFLCTAQIADLSQPEGGDLAAPIRLQSGGVGFEMSHWADRSSRETMKLYAGNRSAFKVASDMLERARNLWPERGDALLAAPFDELAPMAGSFNFDARSAWTAIDTGYSPDKHRTQGNNVLASPFVQVLAAAGLQHARPAVELRKVTYAAWVIPLPPLLARAALAHAVPDLPAKVFSFELRLAGKNKITTFAQEVPFP